ncbi:hypothetical protein [Solirubrum puertoriconensis]|uniref:Uncharacterized protein n=1 Tax=Solirubrum puertoriconensis TaxID=1751427 RepID=A0A9X0HP17_SOLP1|nr:hypothetical protein [Solirubrum puertoriconensis]KUG09558.1 hypothetical protein ASU33_17795 [Solirubrum puertoriconensis]
MELDEMRQRWRQQPTEPTARLTPEAMQAILNQPSSSPLQRIRRNAQWEVGLTLLTLPVAASIMLFGQQPYTRTMAGWLLLVAVGFLFYIYQKFRVLNDGLAPGVGDLRQQLEQQSRSLRRLVQIYYRATMLTLFGSFGIGFVMQVLRFAHTAEGLKLALMVGTLVIGYLIIGWLAYLALQKFTRWYLQRLYGQHLDRLEGYLHDLQATN